MTTPNSILSRLLCIGLALFGVTAYSAADEVQERILIVVTSCGTFGEGGKPTGLYLSEVSHPWKVFTEAGYAVDFASPKGGAAPIDPKSLQMKDPVNRAFRDAMKIKRTLPNTLAGDELDASRYKAVWFAGGHGTMYDFREAKSLAAVAAAIYEQGGAVSAVCHGPAALLGITLSDGTALVKGKALTGFTNEEEQKVGLTKVVPYLLEDELKALGATFQGGSAFASKVVVDQRLVTGQNPASATPAANALIQVLKGR